MDLRLKSHHEVSGALFRDEAGWDVPSSYGSLDREVLAVRRDAGAIDFSDRAKVEVTGEDRVTFLDGLVTADVKALAPLTSVYALVLDDKSHVLGDLRVHALEGRYVLDMEASQSAALMAHFRKLLVSDDVVLRHLEFCGHIEVHGPRAPRTVDRVLGVDVLGMSVDASAGFRLDRRRSGYATRIRTTGESGFALWAPGADLADLWDRLVREGVGPVGRDAFDVLRIEAGWPRAGVDMTPATLASEVAPPGAISPTKGCYTGQEVVTRVANLGHVNRRLEGLRVDGDTAPRPGDVVLADDRDAGRVTSACWSPTLGWFIALGLLRIDAVRGARSLFVDRDGWSMRARLAGLPFVDGSA